MEQHNGDEVERVDAQSPTLLNDRVRTPTLIIHSEEDLRCPLGQALRYYTRLKLAGADTELLVSPGENHELSRSGAPHHGCSGSRRSWRSGVAACPCRSAGPRRVSAVS